MVYMARAFDFSHLLNKQKGSFDFGKVKNLIKTDCDSVMEFTLMTAAKEKFKTYLSNLLNDVYDFPKTSSNLILDVDKYAFILYNQIGQKAWYKITFINKNTIDISVFSTNYLIIDPLIFKLIDADIININSIKYRDNNDLYDDFRYWSNSEARYKHRNGVGVIFDFYNNASNALDKPNHKYYTINKDFMDKLCKIKLANNSSGKTAALRFGYYFDNIILFDLFKLWLKKNNYIFDSVYTTKCSNEEDFKKRNWSEPTLGGYYVNGARKLLKHYIPLNREEFDRS